MSQAMTDARHGVLAFVALVLCSTACVAVVPGNVDPGASGIVVSPNVLCAVDHTDANVTVHLSFGQVPAAGLSTTLLIDGNALALQGASQQVSDANGDAAYVVQAQVPGVAVLTAFVNHGDRNITLPVSATVTVLGQQPNATPSAAYFVVEGFPQAVIAGESHTLSVTAYNAQHQVATDYNGIVFFSSDDPNAMLPLAGIFTADMNGIGAFEIALLTSGIHAVRVQDTADVQIFGEQNNITVSPAAFAGLGVTGFPSPATAGVAAQLTVLAQDAYGNTVTDYAALLHTTSSDANAVLPADTAMTRADQGARALVATLTTAGVQQFTVQNLNDTAVQGRQTGIVVSPAAVAYFALSGYPSPAVAAVAHNVTVRAYDAYNNVATDFAGSIYFTSTDTRADLTAMTPFDASDAGQKQVAVALASVGTWDLTVHEVGSASVTGSQNNIVIAAGALARLGVTGFPSPQAAGTPGMVTVTALDAAGNILADYNGTVHLHSTSPNTTLPADRSFAPGDAGSVTLPVTFTAAGTWSLQANDTARTTVAGQQPGIVIAPLAATALALNRYPSPQSAGTAGNVTITAVDTYGNIATGYTGTVHLTSSDGNATLPGDFQFPAQNHGITSLPVTLATAGNQTIRANDTVSPTVAGLQATVVQASGATRLSVSGFPNPANVGTAANVVVTALDAYANVAAGYRGTVHLSSSDPGAALPGNVNYTAISQGRATLPVTLNTVGAQSINANDVATFAINGNQQVNVVGSGIPVRFSVVGFPSPQTAGVQGNITVTVLDGFGNPVTGYTGTVHVTSSDPNAIRPLDYTFSGPDSGVATLPVTLTTAGTRAINVNDTTTASVAGAQNNIVVRAAAAARMQVVNFPSPQVAGAQGNVTVRAVDGYGNVATGYSGTVQLFSGDPDATLSGPFVFAAGNQGSAALAVTLKTAGTQFINANDTVVAALNGMQQNIIVTAASAARLSVSGFASPQTAGVQGNINITALDVYGNVATGYRGRVHVSSNDGNAVLPTDLTFASANNGNATLPVTLRTAGTRTINANDTNNLAVSGRQSGIVVNPAAAVRLSASGYPSPIAAGTQGNVTVTALDAFSNVVTGYGGMVHLGSTDPNAITAADFTYGPGNAGVAALAVTFVRAGIQSINANDTSTPTIAGRDANIVVTAGAVVALKASGYAASVTACQSGNITVAAVDGYGNTNPNYTGTVALSTNDPNAALPASGPFAAGTRVVPVTLKSAGNWNIVATDNHGLTVTDANIAVVAGSPNVVLLAMPTTVHPTQSFGGTVAVADNCNNITPGYTGTINLTSTDANGTPSAAPVAVTFAAPDAGRKAVAGLQLRTLAAAQVLSGKDALAPGTINGNANIAVTAQAFHAEWDFTAAARAGYGFDGNKIDFAATYAELTPMQAVVADTNSAAFGAALVATNVRWDNGVGALVLGNTTPGQPAGYTNGAESFDASPYPNTAATVSGTFTAPNGSGVPSFAGQTNPNAYGMLPYEGLGAWCLQANATVPGANALYMKALDLSAANLVMDANSTLSYVVFPNDASPNATAGNSNFVALNLVFTDGTETRNLALTDSAGHTFTPSGQGATLMPQTWNRVQVNLGSLAGKTLSRIDVGWQRPGVTGGFRSWFDEVQISGVTDNAQTNHAELAADWTPQYAGIAGYWKFNGFGLVGNNTLVPSTVGPAIYASNADGLGLRYVQGRLNQAIYVDGNDDALRITSSSFPSGTQMTVAGWVKADEAPALSGYCGPLFYFGQASGSNNFVSFVPQCTAPGATALTGRFYTQNGPSATANTGGTPGYTAGLHRWAHVAMTVDAANNANMYINGQYVTNGTTNVALASVTGAYNYFAGGPNGGMRGYLDDMAVWSSVLSADEVRVLFDRQSARYSGVFTSRALTSPFQGPGTDTMAWVTNLPSYKALPGAQASENTADYVSLSNSTLESGLAGLWHFDETRLAQVTGGDFYDDTGLGNTAFSAGGTVGGGNTTAGSAGLLARGVTLNGNYVTTTTAVSNPQAFTLSVWVNTTSKAGGKFIGFGDKQTGLSGSYDRHIWMDANGIAYFGTYGQNGIVTVAGSKPINDGAWHHLTATADGTTITLYIDGVAVGSGNNDAQVMTGYWRIGGDNLQYWPSTAGYWLIGRLDEAAVWTRALAQPEVAQLYRRGATRLKYRLRTCASSSCVDNQPWQGPDGTYETYFSELVNLSGTRQAAAPPNLNLATYAPGFGLDTNQPYIQYQAVFESDDAATQCTYNGLAAPCSAENSNITFARLSYDTSLPVVSNANTVPYYALSAFADSAGGPGCPDGITFALSPTGATFYYFNGSTWIVSNGTAAQTNTQAQLSATALAHFGTQFGVGQTYFHAYLMSQGVHPCSLASVVIDGTQ